MYQHYNDTGTRLKSSHPEIPLSVKLNNNTLIMFRNSGISLLLHLCLHFPLLLILLLLNNKFLETFVIFNCTVKILPSAHGLLNYRYKTQFLVNHCRNPYFLKCLSCQGNTSLR